MQTHLTPTTAHRLCIDDACHKRSLPHHAELSHIHTRVGFMLWDFESISLSKILVFSLFSFQDSFFRLGYESATLLMVMITDSSRSISCSMRRADMTLPCTCWLGGWLQHMRANCFALSYPVLSSHRHSLPTCTVSRQGQVMLGLPPPSHTHAYSTCSCPAPFLHPVPPHSETAVGYEKVTNCRPQHVHLHVHIHAFYARLTRATLTTRYVTY